MIKLVLTDMDGTFLNNSGDFNRKLYKDVKQIKGTTVEHLQQLLNVTPEETMAFGDGYNDLELMTRANYSFAVRNAVQELKEAANFITRSNEEDAVMKTIIPMLYLQEKIQ
ncbi:hypothetical protein FA727_15335 [Robertmurraya kyonggiensis]|uniref:Haloacid dehalogenase-like hydrolase n=1 Tax=Robertmurraya kyonggiensis TaxID=1037680 RepID=A0A4U1D3L0_9BACI|nr:HAD hydrolase family protein [Robertmurraya kyonggiensis]TKC16323.1 hypothetical protein FA727_15335 [Robertmurraya kyonggiensis]